MTILYIFILYCILQVLLTVSTQQPGTCDFTSPTELCHITVGYATTNVIGSRTSFVIASVRSSIR